MSQSQIALVVSVGVLGGILFGSVQSISMPWLFTAAAFFVVLFVGAYLWQWRRGAGGHAGFPLIAASWLLAGAVLGAWRVTAELRQGNEFAAWLGTKQDFEAVVVTEPDIRPDKQLLTVRPDGFRQSLLLTVPVRGYFRYGDRLWLRGKVTAAKVFDDFDYPGYLARHNVYGLLYYPKAIVIRGGEGSQVVRRLLAVKAWVVATAGRYYAPVQRDLVLGILIGARRGLPPEVVEQFARTGTSHIMAVSGSNMTIVLAAFGLLAYLIGRRAGGVVSLCALLGFTIIAGPSGAVVRAALMGLLVLASLHVGRLYLPLPGLLLVAAGMALANPRIVYWDVGFQLSVAATAGIVLAMPLVRSRLAEARLRWLWQTAAASLAAIVFTLPVSLWQFHSASTVALLANSAVVPAVPVVMLLGALSLLPVAGPGFAWVNSWAAWYVLKVVGWLAGLPWAQVVWRMPGSVVLLLYALLGVVFWRLSAWQRSRS